MTIEIIVNDVGNGDALLVALKDDSRCCIIVLDGGRERDAETVLPQLRSMLDRYGKVAPDLFIGTHFDNDHIAGLQPLIKQFKDHPTVLWMFNTSPIRENFPGEGKRERSTESMFPSEADVSAGGDYSPETEVVTSLIIETAKKEQEIREYAAAHHFEVKEPFAGECVLQDWPEIKILGPTKVYYESLFSEPLEKEALVREILSDGVGPEETANKNPCAGFTKKTSPISRVNLISVIFSITAGPRVYLFAGDAGIQSFYAIPQYHAQLKNIYWLKQPHHGSANNFNSDLLDFFHPTHIAISGAGHISDALLHCLQSKGSVVQTTRDSGTIHYPA